MRFDFAQLAARIEKASPRLAKAVSVKVLNLVSPFNSHLKAELVDWSRSKASLKVKNHRGVKNHLGGIHAGALFTLGETCAGFVILKNFSFKIYRPIMTEINVTFSKQARDVVVGVCQIKKDDLAKTKAAVENKRAGILPMTTIIKNLQGEIIAEVHTKWQIKAWDQIRINMSQATGEKSRKNKA